MAGKQAPQVTTNIEIENGRIGFRNFSGAEGKYNTKGNRNFAVFLDDDLAHVLERDGWNVKWLKPRSEDEDPQAYMQVKVAFGKMPPNIIMIANGKKTKIDEDTVNILDWAEIQSVDMIIRPYNYDIQGKQGVKGYLKSLYVTIVTDRFAGKYQDAPDSAQDLHE